MHMIPSMLSMRLLCDAKHAQQCSCTRQDFALTPCYLPVGRLSPKRRSRMDGENQNTTGPRPRDHTNVTAWGEASQAVTPPLLAAKR